MGVILSYSVVRLHMLVVLVELKWIRSFRVRQGQKLDLTASPGLDHLDQLGLTWIGLKILRGTQTDLKIFRRYKKYDLPQTSSCIGLHFMQQQPGKMQDGSAILLHL